MPAFRFEAADADGRIASGTLDAESPRQARSQLRERGLTPVRVDAVEEVNRSRSLTGRIGSAELALVTRQLASLLAAGLPLERALSAVMEQAERGAVRDRVGAVRGEVLSGHSLAEALTRYPRDFPDVYRALVAAGEQSGDLALVMSRLAEYVESRSALGQKLLMAFTYPAIVTLVAIAVITGLLAYVVPQVVGVFAQTRQQLPLLTTVLISLSDFVRAYWWVMLALVIGGFVAFRVMMRNPQLRLAWHGMLLGLPIAGRLIRGLNTARFASTLAILTTSGVPLLRALDAGAQTLGNLAMRENVADAIVRVREGSTLSRALSAHGQFPPIVIHLIASGEATGEMPRMLERAALAQSQEVERRAFTLTSLLEPLLVLVMGAVVLLIVLAVLLPIIEINQLVR